MTEGHSMSIQQVFSTDPSDCFEIWHSCRTWLENSPCQFLGHVVLRYDLEKIGKKHVFLALAPHISYHNSGSTKHRKLVDGLFGR